MFVFFPARLIELNPKNGSSCKQLDAATKDYTDQGIVILDATDNDNVKDALKIIEFSKAFPYINDPKLDGVKRPLAS